MTPELMKIAENLVIASKRAYNRGIQTGSGGNVSARIPGTDTMLVKASGGSLGDCTPESFLITDFEGNLIEGSGKPTREAFLHGYIYKVRPDVNAVVHVHSPYAIGYSSTKKDLPLITWHSQLKNPAPYPTLDVHAAMVRPEDVDMVKEMFEKTPAIKAFLLADHGVVAMGRDAVLAEHEAELVEETAQVTFLNKLAEKIGL
ncbi:MAG: class II aldolase/adducin family protein [Lachnospiraceae bacterium]|nr:class II aldolase/adducin family protein [Lachnospiraceae bacterium]